MSFVGRSETKRRGGAEYGGGLARLPRLARAALGRRIHLREPTCWFTRAADRNGRGVLKTNDRTQVTCRLCREIAEKLGRKGA